MSARLSPLAASQLYVLLLLLHPLNGLVSRTTWVSRYTRKVKPDWIQMRQEMMGF